MNDEESIALQQPVTIRQVARHAGVSPMTVSRVINGGACVRSDTRQRVEQAISDLGYVPNTLARGLSRRATSTIALIVPDVANPFFTKIVHGAEDVARRAGFRPILCNTEESLALEQASLRQMVAYRVAGLLIAPVNDSSRRELRRLEQHGMPYVLMDRSVANLTCDLVQSDSIGGARRLVEHLLDLGHRRIAFIGSQPNISTARDRLRGYREALQRAGIPQDETLVVESTFQVESGYAAAQHLLDRARPPSAILAVNNFVAVGVVRAARERGLRIPEDLALVCFDDVEHAALLCPFLTVMEQPAELFGTIAAQILLDRIAGRGSARPRQVVLSAELLVRRSCGAALGSPGDTR
jgi:LacI family transcriptional regulator